MQINAEFPIDEPTRIKRAIRGRIHDDMETLMMQLGVQALSFIQLDYREKARGGTGSDGTTWAPLKRSTLETRVRRRAPARRIVEQRKQLAEEIRQTKNQRQKQRLRQRRRQLLDRLTAMIDEEENRHEIGVDTGLQRASAAPGFTDPVGVWVESPDDGQGENVFDVQPGRVTVGYNRTYSEEFDAQRKLVPDEPPDDWQQAFDGITQRWVDRITQEEVAE